MNDKTSSQNESKKVHHKDDIGSDGKRSFLRRVFKVFTNDEYYIVRTTLSSALSMFNNFIWASLKFLFGLWKASYFFCVSGIYTLCIGLCKRIFLHGRRCRLKDDQTELHYYTQITIVLFIASVFYSLYMTRLFFIPEDTRTKNPFFAIVIMAFSCWELFLAIKGLIKMTKRDELLVSGLKCVSLMSGFTSVVSAQFAFMEIFQFTRLSNKNQSRINAITGVVFGSLCILIAIGMMIKIIREKKKMKLKNV